MNLDKIVSFDRMKKLTIKLLFLHLIICPQLQGQNSEMDRLIKEELKMTFPSIYFKHNTTEYAIMPYTVDSCFKHMALYVKDINSFVIWRDSVETEALTNKRIKKLKTGLNKYTPSRRINIQSMGRRQKISRHTIDKSINNEQAVYLLSLNSVLDLAKAHFPTENKITNHMYHPRLTCWDCWKNGFHLQTRRKLRKMEKRKN